MKTLHPEQMRYILQDLRLSWKQDPILLLSDRFPQKKSPRIGRKFPPVSHRIPPSQAVGQRSPLARTYRPGSATLQGFLAGLMGWSTPRFKGFLKGGERREGTQENTGKNWKGCGFSILVDEFSLTCFFGLQMSYNLWIVSKPKTWSCAQLASCSSLQWVLVPTMKKCINLYSKCPCQLINHFITICQLHLFQVHRIFSRNPSNGPMGKVRAPFPQRWWGNRHRCQWIYQSWWNLRTHLQPGSVTWFWLLSESLFCEFCWGSFFLGTKKKVGRF